MAEPTTKSAKKAPCRNKRLERAMAEAVVRRLDWIFDRALGAAR